MKIKSNKLHIFLFFFLLFSLFSNQVSDTIIYFVF